MYNCIKLFFNLERQIIAVVQPLIYGIVFIVILQHTVQLHSRCSKSQMSGESRLKPPLPNYSALSHG